MHRRSLLAALGASGVLTTLAACGGGDDPATGGSAGSPSTSGGGAFPVTVTHKFGSTVVESAPTRVVTVGYNEEDFVLALGCHPRRQPHPLGAFDATKRPWAVDLLPGR